VTKKSFTGLYRPDQAIILRLAGLGGDYFPTDAKGIWAELVKEADAKVRGSLELIFK